ncbi:MAG: exodeoxyribonuclease VII large subunit [Bacillota bacterium]|nr:exodeoxyribonuclease VII large subunit [Bacillota bacterium]
MSLEQMALFEAADRDLSVGELARRLRLFVEAEPELQDLRVLGEISNWKDHSSGHAYFTLKDATAQIRCVMFRDRRNRLAFQPADGMLVRARGDVGFYERGGDLQLYVRSLEEAGGPGELFRQLEALKRRLEAEGLFDPARKRPLPVLPRRIGVVTSPTGAAIRDIVRVSRQRFPGMALLLFPTPVQGEEAPPAIVHAIELANRVALTDVLIVGRGGGSAEELWAFNDERVVRAIAASRIPVVSAIGHEVDFTLADAAADLRAATPSAAAEQVVPSRAQLEAHLEQLSQRLVRGLRRRLDERRKRLDFLGRSRVLRSPRYLLVDRAQRLDELGERLDRALAGLLRHRRERVVSAGARLEALNPLAVLARGYAIVRRERDGAVLRAAAGVEAGEAVEAVLHRGRLHARVERVEVEKEAEQVD